MTILHRSGRPSMIRMNELIHEDRVYFTMTEREFMLLLNEMNALHREWTKIRNEALSNSGDQIPSDNSMGG